MRAVVELDMPAPLTGPYSEGDLRGSASAEPDDVRQFKLGHLWFGATNFVIIAATGIGTPASATTPSADRGFREAAPLVSLARLNVSDGDSELNELLVKADQLGARRLGPEAVTAIDAVLRELNKRGVLPRNIAKTGDESIVFSVDTPNGLVVFDFYPENEAVVLVEEQGRRRIYEFSSSNAAQMLHAAFGQ